MSDSFYTASDARQQTVIRGPILEEISLIQVAVSAAIEAGQLTIMVGPASDPAVTTGFTNSEVAYQSYSAPSQNKTDAHNVARYQMNQVMASFTKLGYSIVRQQEGSSDTFNWILKW